MPIQFAIHLPGSKETLVKTFQLTAKSNVFILPLEVAPEKVILDPDLWLLMDATFAKAGK
jgi:aminopeptidase N